MPFSVFDLFKIGIGPSSSHTVGPMVAARNFVMELCGAGLASSTLRLTADLYGSLALTGKGHATDRAILLGLSGLHPEHVEHQAANEVIGLIRSGNRLVLPCGTSIAFDEARDIRFLKRETMPFHSNAMRFIAYDGEDNPLLSRLFYSVGGGAIVEGENIANNAPASRLQDPPYPFRSAADLLAQADDAGMSISGIAMANEIAAMPEERVRGQLNHIAQTMNDCIERGIATPGTLPGGLHVLRRAPAFHATILSREEQADPLRFIDWVNLWALAVNEENAAGGCVVTAPTNGAAGIIPATLRYYQRMVPGASEAGVADFLLVAGAIGSLFKENSSISGAEVGCQGEVGVACSMAAAGLTAVLGGSNAQIENAAEIGMEHNLGLTCDPIGGLVQVPCIERNAVGAIKAIEASRLALMGDGNHRVSLDQVMATMLSTGRDMNTKYKETSLGGLAVNVVEC